MDITRIQERLRALKDELPANSDDPAVTIYCGRCAANFRIGDYGDPHGYFLQGYGADADEAIDDLTAKYRERRERDDENAAQRMALAIIKATYDFGECCKSQLRQEFGTDVDRLGDRALAIANDMAEAGPFSLTEDMGVNAA